MNNQLARKNRQMTRYYSALQYKGVRALTGHKIMWAECQALGCFAQCPLVQPSPDTMRQAYHSTEETESQRGGRTCPSKPGIVESCPLPRSHSTHYLQGGGDAQKPSLGFSLCLCVIYGSMHSWHILIIIALLIIEGNLILLFGK